MKNKINKILIFGAGSFGQSIYNYLFKKQKYRILAFCDNDEQKQGKFLYDLPILKPKDIENIDFDLLIIATSYAISEVKNQLLALKIPEEKIIENIYHCELFSYNQNVQDLLYEIMFFLCELFNKNDIDYHIDHGSLLGIIREDKFLDWDSDVDFGINAKDYQKVKRLLDENLHSFSSAYSQNKFYYKDTSFEGFHKLCIINHAQALRNVVLGEAFVDLRFKSKLSNKVQWLVLDKVLSCQEDIIFPCVLYKFKNHLIKVPKDCENYLKAVYGKDWKKPKKSFSYDDYACIKS